MAMAFSLPLRCLPSNSVKADSPKTLLETRYDAGASARGVPLGRDDVSADGQRFLLIKEESGAGSPEELKRLVPPTTR